MTAATVPAQQNGSGAITSLAEATNDAEDTIQHGVPYVARFTVEGTSAMLFHRWSTEDVAAKAAAAKGSTAKKTDNVESYVYRADDGSIGVPGEYMRMAIIEGARYKQDPRSPRKSARDLYKAGIVSLIEVCPITNAAGKAAKDWDYLDQRRVMVQRNGVTRVRPAFHKGWKATFEISVLTPEYIAQETLREVVESAGRLVGLADFRPTYGRFSITNWEIQRG